MPVSLPIEDQPTVPLCIDGVPLHLRFNQDSDPSGIEDHDRPSLVGTILPNTSILVVECCGYGGVGLVYRARDLGSDRTLAVKVMRPDRPGDLDGFAREIEVLHRIRSPWVVGFEGSGVLDDGCPWLAMEYLEGHTLADVLASGELVEPVRVVRWLRQACHCLGAIHDAGWVHRDVKPSNFILAQEPGRERIKVIDLGIAARCGVSLPGLSGTPEYIAPEQAVNEPVDPRSDVYALGCCAYELLTGEPVVFLRDPIANIRAHIEGLKLTWPDPEAVPRDLRHVIERCMARAPEDRPASTYALATELAQGVRPRYERGERGVTSGQRPFEA